MYIVIGGCSSLGRILAQDFSKSNFDVVVIDLKKEAFKKLSLEFSGKTVLGSIVKQNVLKEAGIEHADIFLALTDDDDTNIISSQIAKDIFKVEKVAAVINNPQKLFLCRERGIEVLVKSQILAQHLKKICLSSS